MKRVLVICTGNICRSPMAEAVLREAFVRQGMDVQVSSAGLAALVGRPADQLAVDVAGAHGIDLATHRARQITPDMLRAADLILVMEEQQKAALETGSPTSRGKVFRLGHWQGMEIADPYCRGRGAFESVLRLIEQSSKSWLPYLSRMPG